MLLVCICAQTSDWLYVCVNVLVRMGTNKGLAVRRIGGQVGEPVYRDFVKFDVVEQLDRKLLCECSANDCFY